MMVVSCTCYVKKSKQKSYLLLSTTQLIQNPYNNAFQVKLNITNSVYFLIEIIYWLDGRKLDRLLLTRI